MTKQELLEAGMTKCPNPMRTVIVGPWLIGHQRASDFWMTRAKGGSIDRHVFTIDVVTDEDDSFVRIVIGKSQFCIVRLYKKAP